MNPTAQAPTGNLPRSERVLPWIVALVTVATGVVYTVARTHLGAATAFTTAALTCAITIVHSVRIHRPRHAWTWYCLAGACIAFLAGAVLRLADNPAVQWSGNALTLTGYLLFLAAVTAWLTSSNGRIDWTGIADALIVGLGAALTAWTVFIAPVLSQSGTPLAMRALAATYPVLDVVLLCLLAAVVFNQVHANAAFTWFMTAMGAFLAADLAYVATDCGLASWTRPEIDLPYLLAYGCVGIAAAHPSMRSLPDHCQPERSRRRDAIRAGAITASLLSAAMLPVIFPARSGFDVGVRIALTVAVVVIVVGRTLHAIDQFSDAEARSRHRALHDPLTGLPNREGLTQYLTGLMPTPTHGAGNGGRRATNSPNTISVLFLDLDGFKLVNDSYGHEVGDQLLCQVAQRLKTLVRDDDMVSRLGGDEFVIVVRQNPRQAVAVANRIVEAFASAFTVSVGQVFVSTSVGISTTHLNPTDDDIHAAGGTRVPGAAVVAGQVLSDVDSELLVRNADIAMYAAKTGGRNRVAVFDESLREKIQRRVNTETALRFAVERDELELHYQPLVRLSDDTVIGYEALVRWNHPRRGLVSPLEFIPIAEETGLIVPIGEWVIRTAVEQTAAWRTEGRDVHVAVNVSARQLRDPNLRSMIASALRDAGLDPSALWLELTETALVDDPTAAMQILTELRHMGVRVAIDDFGTGYSSLGYLKRFPVSVVKIDREFVKDIGRDIDDDEIVRAIAGMARALGLTLVAEGVENVDQAQALAALGCDVAQGWLYGRPSPAEAVTWTTSSPRERTAGSPRPHRSKSPPNPLVWP